MALHKIYEITTTDRNGDAVVLSLFQDLSVAPPSVKVLPLSTNSREIGYQFSNDQGKGVLSYTYTMELFADSDLVDVFTSEDIIRLEVTRDGNDLFTGTYNYSTLRKKYDPNLGRNVIQVTFVDGMSRLKNVSTKRYPFTGGGEIALYGLIFIEMLPIMGYPADKGGLFHRWESQNWIPSGVNIKQQFLEMRVNYNLFAGQTYAQIMQTLCESFNFVIGNSISGTDVRLILYSAGSTGSSILGQLVNAATYTDQTLTIPDYTAKVARDSNNERLRRLGLITANIRGDIPNAEIGVTGLLGYNYDEFDYELQFDPQVTAAAQNYGVSVRGSGGTYVAAQEFDQVNPASLATTFDLDAALVFDIGQYRQTNNDVFSGVIRDRVDPMLPFILDGKVFRMVRGSYNYKDVETNITRAVQIGDPSYAVYSAFEARVLADSGTFETPVETRAEIERLADNDLLDSLSLGYVAGAYKASKWYNIKGATGDLDVTRASTADRTARNGSTQTMGNNITAVDYSAGVLKGAQVFSADAPRNADIIEKTSIAASLPVERGAILIRGAWFGNGGEDSAAIVGLALRGGGATATEGLIIGIRGNSDALGIASRNGSGTTTVNIFESYTKGDMVNILVEYDRQGGAANTTSVGGLKAWVNGTYAGALDYRIPATATNYNNIYFRGAVIGTNRARIADCKIKTYAIIDKVITNDVGIEMTKIV